MYIKLLIVYDKNNETWHLNKSKNLITSNVEHTNRTVFLILLITVLYIYFS